MILTTSHRASDKLGSSCLIAHKGMQCSMKRAWTFLPGGCVSIRGLHENHLADPNISMSRLLRTNSPAKKLAGSGLRNRKNDARDPHHSPRPAYDSRPGRNSRDGLAVDLWQTERGQLCKRGYRTGYNESSCFPPSGRRKSRNKC